MTCTCGEAKLHVIARGLTADGLRVQLWSDGAVTGQLGVALPGLGLRCPSLTEEQALRAGWLAIEQAPLYDLAEIPALVKASRKAVRAAIGPCLTLPTAAL